MMSRTALVAAALACGAEAFAPSTGGFSMGLRSTSSSSSSFCPSLRTQAATVAQTRRAPGHSVAVSMNLGERFVRLVKANVNELLSKNEDPEKMLNQIVEDMQVGRPPHTTPMSHT